MPFVALAKKGRSSRATADEDLTVLDRDALIAEVEGPRAGIRDHRQLGPRALLASSAALGPAARADRQRYRGAGLAQLSAGCPTRR
ncbi:MAG: hypothetical protein V4466_13000 [Pseudomonadota bacterium]